MNGNPNAVFSRTDIASSVNFGEAVHEAVSKGASLSDVLGSIADDKPVDFIEASRLAREFGREVANA